jgi:ketosteroid isomerase-like protein
VVSNGDRLYELLAPVFGSLEPVIDEETIDAMVAALEPIATDDFVCAMVAFDVEQEFQSTDGIRAAWMDWLEAYTELRFGIEGFQDHGDNVLMNVTQTGITRHGGVEVEQPSAAVWKFRGELLRRLEFHLDRRAAERSAQSTQE